MFDLIKKLCPPALVYLVLYTVSLISQIVGGSASVASTTVGILMIFIWVWLLNYLCSKGYETVSWVLVFLPFILIALIFIFAASLVGSLSKEEKKEMIKEMKKE
jgi:hypothetical protein